MTSAGAQRPLSDAQIAAFHRDGLLGPLPAYETDAHLAHVRELLLGVETDRRVHPLYGRYSPRDWHLVDPILRRLLTHPVLVGQLQQIMGRGLMLWRSKAFIKPPHGGPIGWHQEWGSFNGAELGNDVPALQPAPETTGPWNVTIWFALEDISDDMGPLRFVRGSHTRHRPVAQVPFTEAAFFEDPFSGITDPQEIVRRTAASTLLLDIDTGDWFDGMDVTRLTLEDAKGVVLDRASRRTGEITLPFEAAPEEIVTLPMACGQYVIFYERTLHGSAASDSPRTRSAVNGRVTPSTTLVYPQRLRGEFVDGSNVDIRPHVCVLLDDGPRHPANVYATSET